MFAAAFDQGRVVVKTPAETRPGYGQLAKAHRVHLERLQSLMTVVRLQERQHLIARGLFYVPMREIPES